MQTERTPRDQTTRKMAERQKRWQPADALPTPNPVPGYVFRWIRVAMVGQADPKNIASKIQEGYEPVKAADHPEISLLMSEHDKFKDNIVIGGLMLCKMPAEFVEDRNSYYLNQSNQQLRAVDNHFMKDNDPRMPLFKDRKTSVSFGRDALRDS